MWVDLEAGKFPERLELTTSCPQTPFVAGPFLFEGKCGWKS